MGTCSPSKLNVNSITGTTFDDVIRLSETSNPNASSGVLRGGDGADILQGHNGFDQLFGGNGNDQLYGKNNDDRLNGGAGADRLDGGDGNDTIVYENGAPIQVDLVSGGRGGEAEGDTYFSIENVMVQSHANDIIWGRRRR